MYTRKYIWDSHGQSSVQQEDSFHHQIGLKFKGAGVIVKCYIWSTAFYGTETWTLRKADQKSLESFEMWWWRRTEKFGWTDRVKNEDVLVRVKEERNILNKIKRRKYT